MIFLKKIMQLVLVEATPGATDDARPELVRRLVIANYFTLTTIGLAIIYGLLFAFMGQQFLTLTLLPGICICIGALWLNSHGHSYAGRVTYFVVSILHAVFYSVAVGPEAGLQLFLLPFIIQPVAFFEFRNSNTIVMLTLLPVVSYLFLIFFGFNFSWVKLEPAWEHTFSNLTIFMVMIYLFTSIFAFFRSNTEIERDLRSTISDLHREIYERTRTESKLKKARKNAENANAAKSNFLAHMSHEIRTPIGIIMGNVELMQIKDKEQQNQQFTRHLDAIGRNATHLLNLIGDILDISTIEAGELKIKPATFDLVSEVKNTISLLRGRAEAKKLRFLTDFSSELPEFVYADPMRLRQILVNIIGNAVKFTDEGSITVSLYTGEHPTEKQTSMLIVRVKDTGIGIPDDLLPKLFTSFRQGDDTTSRDYGGTGLGLFISRKIAKAMGGDVKIIFTSPGDGSEFEISIDSGVQYAQKFEPVINQLETSKSAVISGKSGPLEGKSVLVVDDNEDNLHLMQQFLEQCGASVDLAEDGNEAVSKALSGLFHIVLMDIQLPRKDGYQATKELKDAGYTAPIIAVTAHAFRFDRARCLAAGCDDFLAKPVSMKSLVDTVQKWAGPH